MKTEIKNSKAFQKKHFILLNLIYFFLFIANNYCVDGNPRYWSDYYENLDKKREGYNNPNRENFCDGLKTCLRQCYDKVPRLPRPPRERGIRIPSDDTLSFYLVNCEKKCKNDYLCNFEPR